MVRRHYNFPPLTTLSAFEAAARNGGFKIAAQELNVTPGAISHQIKALEMELGRALFKRVHRGVILTEDGQNLFVALQSSFRTIAKALEQIRRPQLDESVTIGATAAVSSLWLTPRITRFWREFPDIRISQIVSDSRLDIGISPDLRIEYGHIGNSPEGTRELFTDDLVAVASSGFAAAHPVDTAAQLAGLPLIHLNAEDQDWTTWKQWFDALGYSGPLGSGTSVNNYMIALQAAQDGVGVVLGWKRLIRPFLENGTLVILGRFSMPAPRSFLVIRDRDASHDARLDVIEAWMLENV
ncbi:MAG: LysR substrate-binding domain-containing protein [Albidovulum sp.]